MVGFGASTYCRTSGLPCCAKRMAFMLALAVMARMDSRTQPATKQRRFGAWNSTGRLPRYACGLAAALGVGESLLRMRSIGSVILGVCEIIQMIERLMRDNGNGSGRTKSTKRTTRYASVS